MEKQARYIEEFPDTNINIIRMSTSGPFCCGGEINLPSLFLEGMRNLSISCSLVSLIILGASLVVFWIGLIEREVPPVLVVSVLYLLSGGSNVAQNAICEWRKYEGCFHPPRSSSSFQHCFQPFPFCSPSTVGGHATFLTTPMGLHLPRHFW